jgi:hypothetical protein
VPTSSENEGKIEGWFEVNGGYRSCPVKLKAWMETDCGRPGKILQRAAHDLEQPGIIIAKL